MAAYYCFKHACDLFEPFLLNLVINETILLAVCHIETTLLHHGNALRCKNPQELRVIFKFWKISSFVKIMLIAYYIYWKSLPRGNLRDVGYFAAH